MTLTCVALSNDEKFLRFLDPDLLEINEEHEVNGLRRIEMEYTFQDLDEDEELFKIGNKIWVQGDLSLTDCLYVINTPVTRDLHDKNNFTFEAEEVLTELNYASLFSHTELTSSNGFTTGSTNGEAWVKVNYNALSYWFGTYFNIGIIQECLNDEVSKISLSGTMTRMSLLRHIEEETGNVFVTRYEKDCLDNTIHRYLDFLNPVSHKNWKLNLEYDFLDEDDIAAVFDADDNPTTDEQIEPPATQDDVVTFEENVPRANINPANVIFRVTDGIEPLNTDGNVYDETDEEQTPLQWTSEAVGFTTETKHSIFSLSYTGRLLALTINQKTFALINNDTAGEFSTGFISVASDPTAGNSRDLLLPNGCWFEIYDHVNEVTLFKTQLNYSVGNVHDEILDLNYNVENIEVEMDEEDTYNAISPILSISERNDASNSLSRTDLGKIINAWRNLSIAKGDTIPMIVEKVSLTTAQKNALGTKSVSSNYYARPYKPQDNIDSSNSANSTYEYWRATAYWKAPFTKIPGELHVTTDKVTGADYIFLSGRPDIRDERASQFTFPKIGTVETSDEDPYAIYNDVAMKLKDKQFPEINIKVDVANLRDGKYNDYAVNDKVYVKIPGQPELITARVIKTEKNSNNVAENTVELGNYSLNVKVAPKRTYIDAKNVSFKYPASKNLTVTLFNEDYNDQDSSSVQKLSNKLLTFIVYKVDQGSTTLTRVSYTKKTNSAGQATISMKFDPGNYKLKISFGGDEEYSETEMTIDVNVSGTKEVPKATTTAKKTTTTTQSKTTKKTTTTTKKTTTAAKTNMVPQKRYYDAFGRSPDKKYIMAIGKRSNVRDPGSDRYFYKTVFVNKCPYCGRATLGWGIFYAGNEYKNWGRFPLTGRWEGGSAEGHIFCTHCDADWSVFGNVHDSSNKKLRVYKKTVRSSKAEAYNLKNAKMYYDTIYVKVPARAVGSNKNRKVLGNPSAYIKRLALNLAGDSQGWAAAKKIAAWFGSNIRYSSYCDFSRGPDSVVKGRSGNCCDQARAMLTTMDAAGCTEFLRLRYVFVCCSSRGVGHVFTKVINKRDGGWSYVDPCKAQPWANYVKGWGRPPGRQSNYPTRPF